MQEKKNCSQTVNSAKFYRSVLNQGITAEKFSDNKSIYTESPLKSRLNVRAIMKIEIFN